MKLGEANLSCLSLCWLLTLAITGLAGSAQVTPSPGFDLPGQAPDFVLQTETPKNNVSTMGLRISSDFDDNALNSAQDRQADFSVFFQPYLGWRHSGPRLDWSVDYALGLSRSGNFAAYDSLSHVLGTEFEAKLTRRLRLIMHESFLSSTNPFDQLQASESATVLAGRGPAETASVTPAEVKTEAGSADIVYVLSRHSTLGVGGEFFGARYSLPSSTLLSNDLLQNSSSVIGHSYYMRQLSRYQWTGIDYRVQKSIFNSGQSSSFVQSLAYTHTIAISPVMTVSFRLGPERSFTQTVTGPFSFSSEVLSGAQPAWHWSGGITGGWSGRRSSLTVRLAKRIDNGGLLGAADLSSGSAEISRPLARQWTARLLASYGHGKALAGSSTLSSFWVAAGLTRTVTPNLSFEFRYWRVQMSSNTLPASLLADHNRISVSLVYEQRQALGR